ncbi:phosphoribosylglycinamide formyltransferase [Algimonas ampicilliniresistens]|uniref:Phosphoribosylglycinamide formyltransferase n=1 Tax=Algimonas ampicilliniresistens TaxID=1298735 RepID=A0ABQ5VC97_9PROT|nr:phosphoribosylglycinamide formyltransferase [Algimonas ampicilliniresistens]GLQ25065.1 phosphoribosylglycinamide formyltransferase [Algimonas ampicilliniresistens]
MTPSVPRRLRTAVLISGRGSNMMALVNAAQQSDYPADIRLVISNKPEAEGLRRADAAGVKALAIDHKDFETREAFERELDAALNDHNIEFVACAGFMRVLTNWFVARWDSRLINIHPSLLPKYKGLHTHRRALEAGDTVAGASVHWVVSEVDGGSVIDHETVNITPQDTEDSLMERVLARELILYPRALATAAKDVLARQL